MLVCVASVGDRGVLGRVCLIVLDARSLVEVEVDCVGAGKNQVSGHIRRG